jgi:integrase
VLPGPLSENFRLLTRELAMPPVTFHGLRHAFATLGLLAGINPKVVSEALGHSSVTITMDTYSHVLPHMQGELAAAIANILKR